MESSKQSVAELIIGFLADYGVKYFYLLPGGGSMYLIDAIAKNSKVEGVPLLHEQSVGVAAEAHAQYLNNLSVAVVTTGPGGTNAITPCAAAWTDSTPVLFISGQVKSQDSAKKFQVRQLGFQETPITQMVSPITKESVLLTEPRNWQSCLIKLIEAATTGRPGPVWLDIPLDVQSAEGSMEKSQIVSVPEFKGSVDLVQVVDEVCDVWSNSKRPILLLGNGVRTSNSIDLVESLARKQQTPMLLSWKAIDFLDESDPLNAGRPGVVAQRWANLALQSCDFLVSLGCRIDTGQSAYNLNTFAPFARKFICDIDPAELRKYPSGYRLINQNVSDFVKEITNVKFSANIEANKEWIKIIENWKETYPLIKENAHQDIESVNLYRFIDALSRKLPSQAILVPGSSGACSELTMQSFKVKKGQRVFNSEGLGPMGFAIPAAIGAHFASGRPIISIDGDGGFMMNIQDLATINLRKLPIKFFVLNNNGYGSIRVTQSNLFERRFLGVDESSGIKIPKLKSMAIAFGLNYSLIEESSNLDDQLNAIFADDYPEIIEVVVSEQHKLYPRVPSVVNSSGTIVSMPMHQMLPSVDDEVFNTLTGLSTISTK